MKQDKEIILFPILSAISSMILFVILLVPFLATVFLERLNLGGLTIYFGVFLFYFAAAFTSTFFNAGIVHIAKTRFEGGDATFMDGIKIGFTHFSALFRWSLLTATVGLILNILQSNAREQKGIIGIIGSIIVSLIGFAWAIVSIFVVPSIVIKGLGPIDALKQSAKTVKKTWGESLIKYYGLGMVKAALIGVGMLILAVPGGLLFMAGAWVAGGLLVGLFILYLVIVSVIFSSANMVYDTALFMYAHGGKVAHGFTKDELAHAFVHKKGKSHI